MESSDKIQSDVDSFGVSTNEKASGAMALETNEDSSYDSDFETDETCTSHADVSRTPSVSAAHQNVSRSSSAGHSATHLDVSRTVSDTLGAEFAEYVNAEALRDQQASCDQKTDTIPDDASATNKKVPGYTTRVEFAVKLGYTEKLVQAALQKLGPEPSQNELLEELIHLSAQSPRVVLSPTASCASDEGAAANDTAVSHSGPLLKPIVIDGSNVAMSHGNKEVFSCRGIKICVDWFLARGHTEITVFVPKWRKEASRPDNPISEQEILNDLERDRLLVFTPSRLVGGKRLVCYDDRYILKLAAEVDGVVVSNDNYRDLLQESPDFRKVVEERILMFSFVNDLFMPPDDPLGRSGPTLDTFLRVDRKHRTEPPPPCPYGKKCTYGNKCKFSHPERGNMPHKSVTERLSEYAQKHIQARGNSCDLKTHSLPLGYDMQAGPPRKTPLGRARSAAPAAPPIDPHSQASVVSHFNRAQTEHRQTVGSSFDALSLGAVADPPKSHSIENITAGLHDYGFGYGVGPGANVNRSRVNYPQRGNPWGGGPPADDSSRWAYTENQDVSEAGGNLHRKLHRQLTLNPAFDPRLYRMRGVNQNSGGIAPPCPSVATPWGSHQTVSRIASAPAACPAWPPAAGQAGVSASEPHLHAQMPSPNASSTWAWTPHRDARNHLYYHLSSIFPEDQVRKAMALYPDETNAQTICAAILSTVHKT